MADNEGFSNVAAELAVASDMGTAVTGILVGNTFHLGKLDLAPTRNTALATLAAGEADFSGYVAKAITYLLPSTDGAGRAEVKGTAPEFRPSSAVVTNAIYYWWVENPVDGLIDAGRFVGAPLQMASPLNSILLDHRLRPGLTSTVVNS